MYLAICKINELFCLLLSCSFEGSQGLQQAFEMLAQADLEVIVLSQVLVLEIFCLIALAELDAVSFQLFLRQHLHFIQHGPKYFAFFFFSHMKHQIAGNVHTKYLCGNCDIVSGNPEKLADRSGADRRIDLALILNRNLRPI